MTARWVISHLMELPLKSRTKQALGHGSYNREEHLLADIRDVLILNTFESSVSAASAAGKEYKTLTKKRPKLPERPGPPKVKEKPKFLTGLELATTLKQMQQSLVINHTQSCQASRVNEGGGEINCACPQLVVARK